MLVNPTWSFLPLHLFIKRFQFKFIISTLGSRDRSILLWPTRPEDPELKPVAKYFDAHKGWVWSFCSKDDLLISGDWDSTMKFWAVSDFNIFSKFYFKLEIWNDSPPFLESILKTKQKTKRLKILFECPPSYLCTFFLNVSF